MQSLESKMQKTADDSTDDSAASTKPVIVLHQAGKSSQNGEQGDDALEGSQAHQAAESEQTEGPTGEPEKIEDEASREATYSTDNPPSLAASPPLKNEPSLPKSVSSVEAPTQQAIQIKELEDKIKRLEAQNKANAETAKEQRLIQQVVMP